MSSKTLEQHVRAAGIAKDTRLCHPYGGTDPLGMFALFLKRTADVMAPVLV